MATLLLLDLYARPLPWQLTIVWLAQLALLSYLAVFLMNAARKKEVKLKNLELNLRLALLATAITLLLPYYYFFWDIASVIVITLMALLITVVIIRGPWGR